MRLSEDGRALVETPFGLNFGLKILGIIRLTGFGVSKSSTLVSKGSELTDLSRLGFFTFELGGVASSPGSFWSK